VIDPARLCLLLLQRPARQVKSPARGELLLLKIEASVLVALEYPAARALVATFSNETTGDDGNGEEQTTDCNKLGLGGTGE
jgi:hypothetical protein